MLSAEVIRTIEEILKAAASEDRQVLYEHEVYRILAAVGIDAPTHVLLRSPEEVTPRLLGGFSSHRIVLKAVSAGLVHKQQQGGVQVVLKDLGFVRYTVGKMIEDFAARDRRLEGILVVDYVEYDKDLGNEILLGFRESAAFGPVISFSKGGNDAEHFAAHFSPPNIILAPVDLDWAHALLSSTQIHVKYLAEGKGDYIDRISETVVKFSDLAVSFSSFFESPSSHVVREFEINPLVFDPYGRMIPLDGYAAFMKKPASGADPADAAKKAAAPAGGQASDSRFDRPDSLRPFFEPQGVAVFGVSASDSSKAGNIIATNLLELGRDDVFCINLKGGEVTLAGRKLPLWPSLAPLKQTPELAIVAVPASATIDVMKECAGCGVRAVLIVPGGFSEATGDTTVEEELLAVAAKHRIRIMGPNCLGVVYYPKGRKEGMNTFFIPEEKFKVMRRAKENVAILSQSGAIGIVEIYNLRNAVSPKAIVSYGNQIDVDPCDLSAYFADDPDVEVVGFYIEGFKPGAGRRFFEISSTIDKPIVVYKAGRTEEGRLATASHTASISGEYAVARAALKQAGLIVAETGLDHMGYIKTFALLNRFPVSGRKVAMITNAGYEKTSAADNIGELELAVLDEKTAAGLKALLPPFVAVGPLLDLTPMVSDEEFARSIDIMLSAEGVDALCISIVPQAQLIHTTDQEVEGYRENVAARIVKIVGGHRKPVVASVAVESGADANYNKFSQIMETGGVPTFLSAERAMMFLGAFIRYHMMKQRRDLAERLR